MTLIAALLAAGLFLFAVVLLIRAWEADTCARSLIRYRLRCLVIWPLQTSPGGSPT